jgi:uncharacterized membrane protein
MGAMALHAGLPEGIPSSWTLRQGSIVWLGGPMIAFLLPTAMAVTVGNLLPRTRPNLAIGIRTRRTLADRAAWATAHRLLEYIVVACGVVTVVGALAVPRPVGPLMIFLVGPAALVVTWVVVRAFSKRRDG